MNHAPFFRIDAPQVSSEMCIRSLLQTETPYCGICARVTAVSPPALRRAVETLAHFFKREGHYDFVGYYADHPPDETVYLWESYRLDAAPGKTSIIGAAGFGIVNWQSLGPRPTLEWVWIHPYERRQGLLTRAWPLFEREHGEFIINPPYTTAMRTFLAKIGLHQHVRTLPDPANPAPPV